MPATDCHLHLLNLITTRLYYAGVECLLNKPKVSRTDVLMQNMGWISLDWIRYRDIQHVKASNQRSKRHSTSSHGLASSFAGKLLRPPEPQEGFAAPRDEAMLFAMLFKHWLTSVFQQTCFFSASRHEAIEFLQDTLNDQEFISRKASLVKCMQHIHVLDIEIATPSRLQHKLCSFNFLADL